MTPHPHRAQRTAFTAALLSGFLAASAARAAETSSACPQNPSAAIAQYSDALKAGGPRADALFKEVPAGLTISADSAAYVVQSMAEARQLPLENAPALAQLGPGDRITALCRVKGPAGDWWLVTKRNDTAPLLYIAASNTKAAEAAGGETAEKPEPRVKDLNKGY